eukprot:CAMPEP_0194346888 /NCGR_PEP_ID=MMETSP0171-20130528/105681_1 /TAXON_ID=218684 /ORGANISM="Corethron pennatum, Strain L29A3" /LENGTH=164 /DNA_ID=CAMNT_0039114071 /DNA_START=487 /DNA_END=981 /DNA_ORIENTATION=-
MSLLGDPAFLVTDPGPHTQIQPTAVILRIVGPDRTAAAPALRCAGECPYLSRRVAPRPPLPPSVLHAPPVVASAAAPSTTETVLDAAKETAAEAQHQEQEHDRQDALVDTVEQKKVGERGPRVLVRFLQGQDSRRAAADTPPQMWVVFFSYLRADRKIRSFLVK